MSNSYSTLTSGPRIDSRGYTLIELVVVISLLSMFLVFFLPRVQDVIISDQTKKVSRWIIHTVKQLKENAVRHQKMYVLNIRLESGKMWITQEGMEEEALLKAEESGFDVPEHIRIVDIEYPRTGYITSGEPKISFYPKGYSDKAIIHAEDEDGHELSYLIEPFLPRVKIFETYVSFQD